MDYDNDQSNPSDVPPLRTAGEIMREKEWKLRALAEEKAAREAQANVKPRDLASGMCAHAHVRLRTERNEAFVTRSWWSCDDCGVYFAPIGGLLPRVAEPFARPSVQSFANAIEERLRFHEREGGRMDQLWLLMRLKQQVLQLQLESEGLGCVNVRIQAAEVANLALMIAEAAARR